MGYFFDRVRIVVNFDKNMTKCLPRLSSSVNMSFHFFLLYTGSYRNLTHVKHTYTDLHKLDIV